MRIFEFEQLVPSLIGVALFGLEARCGDQRSVPLYRQARLLFLLNLFDQIELRRYASVEPRHAHQNVGKALGRTVGIRARFVVSCEVTAFFWT